MWLTERVFKVYQTVTILKKHFIQICQVQEVVWPNSWSGFFIQMFSDLNHNFINVILHTLLLYFIQIKILYGCLG